LQPHPRPRAASTSRGADFGFTPGLGRTSDRVDSATPKPQNTHLAERHRGDRHIAEMAMQLEAVLRRTGPPAPPRKTALPKEPAARREPPELRSSPVECSVQSRPSIPSVPRAQMTSSLASPVDTDDSAAATTANAPESLSPQPSAAGAEPENHGSKGAAEGSKRGKAN
jgi:hypothetical protein